MLLEDPVISAREALTSPTDTAWIQTQGLPPERGGTDPSRCASPALQRRERAMRKRMYGEASRASRRYTASRSRVILAALSRSCRNIF